MDMDQWYEEILAARRFLRDAARVLHFEPRSRDRYKSMLKSGHGAGSRLA